MTGWKTIICPALAAACLLSACGTTRMFGSDDYTDEYRAGWTLFNRPAEDNPSDQLQHALHLFERGKKGKARKQLRALVFQWPASTEAPAAQYRYAQLLEEQGKDLKAFDEYQKLIDEYPGRFPYDAVLNRQFEIAVEFMHRRKSVWFFGGFKAPEKAIPYFEQIIENGPAWHRAANAQFLIGKAYEMNKDYELAVVAYTTVQLRYMKHPVAEEALFHKCVCLRNLSRRNPNDKQMADETLANLNIFLHHYPASEYVEEVTEYRKAIQAHRAELSYKKARAYDRTIRKPKAALIAYRRFLEEFPDSEWTAKARTRIIQLESETQKQETEPDEEEDQNDAQ